MIWWLWTTGERHVIRLSDWWGAEEPDVAWLGECAWTARTDNAGLGLR